MTSSPSESTQAPSSASDAVRAGEAAVDELVAAEGLPAPSFDDVAAASRRLAGYAVRTPLLTSAVLDAATGGRVFIKAEVLQRTGSFKFRGAFNRISQLSAAQRARGVVAYSSGNHAQGVAEAARLVGAPATIFVPGDAPRAKIAGTASRGAQVRTYDRFQESRELLAVAHARATGAALTPPYDHPHTIAGQGTAGLEIAHDLQAKGQYADVVLCPAGGGGLIAGVALAMEGLSPRTRIVSVEPAGYDDHRRSLASGRREMIAGPAPSVCDALMAPTPGRLTFALNETRLSGGVVVTDAEALAAMAFAFHRLKLVLEPGGAVALAAALTGKLDLAGRCAVVVCTGGNVSPQMFARAVGGGSA